MMDRSGKYRRKEHDMRSRDREDEVKITEKQKEKDLRATLQVVITTTIMTTFMASALNLAVPGIGEDFHASLNRVGWIVTVYILAIAALSAPFGKISDMKGKRGFFIWGIFIFTAASVAGIFSWDFLSLILFRMMQGVAASMIFATNMAILVEVAPPEKRGRSMGITSAGAYVGLSIGPVLGGFLNHAFGWHSIFVFSAIVGAYAFVFSLLRLPKEKVEAKEGKLDIPGNILYILMIMAVTYGFSSMNTDSFARYYLIAGAVLLAVFILTELKVADPVIPVRMFAGNSIFTLSNLAAYFNYAAMFAISYLLSIYLQVAAGYTSQTAGMILAATPLLTAAVAPAAGRLSDRMDSYKPATAGMLICTVCIVFFSFLTEGTPVWLIAVFLGGAGIGAAIFSPPNMNAIMSSVDRSQYGLASSIIATTRTLGQTTGMAVISMVSGMYMGNTALSEASPGQLLDTIHGGFLVFVAMCLAGVFMSFRKKKSY